MAEKKTESLAVLVKEIKANSSMKTINEWKLARRAFENQDNPNRVKLYELYEDILINGQLEAVWGKRRDNILNRRLNFVKDGVKDDQINQLLNSPDMRNLLEDLHNTIGYGYTLVQINNIIFDEDQEYYHIEYDLIPRANVHPEMNFECVSIDPNKADIDFKYKEAPLSNYMIWAGKPKDKGLFFKVAPYILYKRGAMGDWAQFSEMFGMPFREALYDAFDEDTRTKVEEMLQNWGAGMSFVHPKSVEVKLHDTGGSTASSDVYDRFIEVCDAAIAKTVVGNTLTTDHSENGNRALGEVHQSEEKEKKLSDELFILSILNTQFRSILKKFGFDVAGGFIWFETPDKDWSALQEKWNVISSMMEKVPVDDDYIYEEFDVPKPENYDELREEMKLEKMAALMPYGFATSEPIAPEPKPNRPSVENKKTPSLISRLVNRFFAKG